jgi:AraC-like DNA-binding protein
VDLAGRLSNPRPIVETLAGQGSQAGRRLRRASPTPRNRASEGESGALPEEEGRLSNPVQRRLSEHDVDDLVRNYESGSSIDVLAARLGVNRTTIMGHLERRGVTRRKVVRKMTDRLVRQAAKRYETGESIKVVAAQIGVDGRTLAREFERAGVATRPRNGWPR